MTEHVLVVANIQCVTTHIRSFHLSHAYQIFAPLYLFYQVNAVKFNEYASVVVSAGYDRSLRAWDCRSQSTEPIQVSFSILLLFTYSQKLLMPTYEVKSSKLFVDDDDQHFFQFSKG